MVNSNVIRGGGLIILAGCYVAVERAFTNNVVNDATNLHVDLVGADRGSMYNVSFVASKLMPRCLCCRSRLLIHNLTPFSFSLSQIIINRLARVKARHCKS